MPEKASILYVALASELPQPHDYVVRTPSFPIVTLADGSRYENAEPMEREVDDEDASERDEGCATTPDGKTRRARAVKTS